MTVPLWVAELAGLFWCRAGIEEPFPRGLRRSITHAFPLAVIYMPRLHLADIYAWLQRNGLAWSCDQADRALRACLVARCGHGFIFIDGGDPEDEQRFSLAHELAHFLRDYWQPRERARRRLGDRVLEVFDGRRPPEPGERLDALLTRVPVGFHWHLLRREETGQPDGAEVAVAEQEADRLAYELLAPARSVLGRLRASNGAASPVGVEHVLQQDYGLPPFQAAIYGQFLVGTPTKRHPLLRQLGFFP